jgi:hypothetical protein
LLDGRSVKKLRPDILRVVIDRADQGVCRFFGVKDMMRLKSETAVPWRKFIH